MEIVFIALSVVFVIVGLAIIFAPQIYDEKSWIEIAVGIFLVVFGFSYLIFW